MKILVTGGAGYIGSHLCKALAKAGYTPICFDNLSNGHKWAVRWGPLIQGDLLDEKALDTAFKMHAPSAVIHLASLIDARESVKKPSEYYQTNLQGTLTLLRAMVRHEILSLIFSSSASVYGTPSSLPIPENSLKNPNHPYGNSKWMSEQLIHDFHISHHLGAISLRYFNAAGADPDQELGEAHKVETHLIPRALLAALKKSPPLLIHGNTLPTPDGTAIRDYIHVTDLAEAHVLALNFLLKNKGKKVELNLGTNQGSSILEVMDKIKSITGSKVPYTYTSATQDAPSLVAHANRAKELLGWKPQYSDLDTIISTAYNWHLNYKE